MSIAVLVCFVSASIVHSFTALSFDTIFQFLDSKLSFPLVRRFTRSTSKSFKALYVAPSNIILENPSNAPRSFHPNRFIFATSRAACLPLLTYSARYAAKRPSVTF